jgi:putative transposase
LVEVSHPELSVRRQCELLGLNRSTFYYEPTGATPEDLRLMRLIDELYTACPFYGSRKITEALTRGGEEVNRKRVQRLMREMGLEAIYPKPRLSAAGRGHKILLIPLFGEPCDNLRVRLRPAGSEATRCGTASR